MGIFDDKRKFKRKVEQTNPTNPTGNVNIDTNKFDIDEDCINSGTNTLRQNEGYFISLVTLTTLYNL